ncbi:hypothetical protein QQM79_15240 [Marinobacteraceae bacterium S3BR75-40.1]
METRLGVSSPWIVPSLPPDEPESAELLEELDDPPPPQPTMNTVIKARTNNLYRFMAGFPL